MRTITLRRLLVTSFLAFLATISLAQVPAQADGSLSPFVTIPTGYDLNSMDGSDDGQKVLNCSYTDLRKYTNNGGASWSDISLPLASGRTFTCRKVSSSQDGNVMVISGFGSWMSATFAAAYVSRDSGATWSALPVANFNYQNLLATVTGDGTKIFYGDLQSAFKVRSLTWSGSAWANDSELSGSEATPITDIVTNTSGSVIHISMSTGGVRYTRDNGNTWGSSLTSDGSTPTKFAEFIWLAKNAGSSSGYGYALVRPSDENYTQDIWRTSNSGATYTKINTLQFVGITVTGITSSANGKRVIVSALQGLYLSTDFGANWRTIDVDGTVNTDNNRAIFGPQTVEGKIYFDFNNSITSTTFSYARPSAPRSIAAGGCSTTANLHWDAATTTEGTISDYSIEYSSNNGSTWNTFAHTASTTTKAAITGLSTDTNYLFRVAAITEYGTGQYVTSETIQLGPSSLTKACIFRPQLSDQSFNSVTVSSDGSKVASGTRRVIENSGVFSSVVSTVRTGDSGANFSNIATSPGFEMIAGSDDGACYFAGSINTSMAPRISKNSGSTWTSTSSAGLPDGYSLGRNLAVGPNCTSGSATYVAATEEGVFISTNGGSTFTKKLTGSYAGIAISTSTANVGAYMVAGTSRGKLMYSQNRGENWLTSGGTGLPNGNWGNIVMSPDGTKVAAVVTGSNQVSKVWISTNGGATFAPVAPFGGTLNHSWMITGSRDGSNRLVAISKYSSAIAYSGDFGQTWKVSTTNLSGSPADIACNSSCSKIYIAASNGLFQITENARIAQITRAASGAPSGAPFSIAPQITISNIFNTAIESENSATITANVASGNQLVGTATAVVSNGVATFNSDLGITAKTGSQTIYYSSPGIDSVFQSIDVTVGPATKFVRSAMIDAGTSIISGEELPFSPSVALTDAYGNVVTSNSSMVVTISISSGGTIQGETSTTLSSGIATFPNLKISGTPGSTYTLAFNGGGKTPFTTTVVTILGLPTKLGVVRSTVGNQSGQVFTTKPQIAIQDNGGNTLPTETRTVYATVSSGGTLLGTTSADAVNGVATFPSNFGISGTAGSTYTITYIATSVLSTFETITVTAGTPNSIALRRSAVGTGSGAPFATQPIIAIRDSAGNVSTSDTTTVVTATISSGGVIIGRDTATAINGLATFSNDFGIGGTAGTTYTLSFSASSFAQVTQAITVTPGPAKRAYITRLSVGTGSGSTFSTQPQVTLKDAQDNVVTNDNTTVVTVTPSAGLFMGGNQSVTVSSGVATFTDLSISGPAGSAFILSYGAVGVAADTQTVTVTAGPAVGIQRTTRPDGASMGTPLVQQPVYRIVDNAGNIKSGDNTTVVTAAISGCNGCLRGETATAVNGVVTFTNLAVIGGSPGFILFTLTAPGLSNSYTDSIMVIKGTPTLTGTTEFVTQYGASAVSITAPTASTEGTFSYTSSNSSILSISSGTFSALDTGTVTVVATFTPTNLNGYNVVSRDLTFIVKKAIPTLTSTSISKTFGDETFTVSSASTSTPGTLVYTSNNPGVISISAGVATIHGAGGASITATFTPTDTARYEITSAIIEVNVAKASQAPLTITTTSGRFGTTLTLATSGGSSGGEVTYVRSGSCTLSGKSLTISAAGASCTVTATMPGGANFNNISSSATVIVFEKAVQSLSVTKPSDRQMSVTPFSIVASSNFTGAVLEYSSSPSSVCTNSFETITMVSVGTCTITINSNGNSDWETATAVTTSFDVTGKANLVLPGIFNFNGNPGTTQNILTSPAKNSSDQDVPGVWTFTVENSNIATINSSNQVVFGTTTGLTRAFGFFTPTDSATYNSGVATFLITTSKRVQQALQITISAVAYGTNRTLAVTGGSGTGAVTYRVASGPCSITGNLLTGTGLGSCLVNATKEADSEYNESSISGSVNVLVKDASILTPSFNLKYGNQIPTVTPLIVGLVSPDSITSFSSIQYEGIDGTIYSNSATAPTAPGKYSITPTAPIFAQGAPGSYLFAIETGTLVISKADQIITFDAIGDMAYRASDIALNPTINSQLSITLTSTTAGVCSLTGSNLTLNALGTCTVVASQAGDTNHNPADSVTRTFQVTSKARPVLGSMRDVSTQYGVNRVSFTAPTVNVSGTLTYTSSNSSVASLATNDTTTITVIAPGSALIVATFTPSNTSLYEVVSETMTVTVSKTMQSALTVPSATKTIGETFTVTVTGGSGTGNLSYLVTSGSCTFTLSVISSTSAQSCGYRVTKAGDSNYDSVSGTGQIIFEKAIQTVTFPAISNRIFSPTPFLISAPSSSSGATPTVTSETQDVCTINGLQVTIVSQGLCTLKAAVLSSANFQAAADVFQNFTISGKASVTISSNHTIPTTLRKGSSVSISGGSASVPGTYSYQSLNTSFLTTSGDSITAVAPGTAVVKATFTPTDSNNFESKVTLHEVSVGKALQNPVTLSLSRLTVDVNETSTITAGGGSGTGLLAVVISSGPCVLLDSVTVTTFDYGSCAVRAEVQGDTEYENAVSPTLILNVVDSSIVPTPPSTPSSGGFFGGGGSYYEEKIQTLTYELDRTNIKLKWSGNATPVKISVKAQNGSVRVIDVSAEIFEATVTDLIPGFAYTITVMPIGGQDASASKSISIALRPRQPAGVKVEAISERELRVVWFSDPGIAKVKALLTAPNTEPVSATSDGTSVSLTAKPGVLYELQLTAIGASDVSADPLIIRGSFIPLLEVKPLPESSTGISKKIQVLVRNSLYFAPSSMKLDSKELLVIKSMQRAVKKGVTLTCIAYTSSKAPSKIQKSVALKQAQTLCKALAGGKNGITQISKVSWIKSAAKETRVSSSKTKKIRVDAVISTVAQQPTSTKAGLKQ